MFAKFGAQRDMTATVSFGQQCLQRLSHQFVTTIPEQFCQLAIHQLDASLGINNKDAIWVGFDEHLSLPSQGFRGPSRDA